ncbi:MAG: DUF432 domain-containing protein [Candidatus Nezhaarchaeales archaeon]
MIYGRSLSPNVIAKLREHGIQLEVEKIGTFTMYRREGGFPEGPVEKSIGGSRDYDLMIYPVHSVQMEVSTYLLFRLAKPLVVAPRSNLTIYVKAPISVGIYVVEGGSQRLIDFFGFAPYKYALYGTSAGGVICRFHRSDVFSEPPQPELWEAITRISIENSSEEFMEVKNVVYPLLNADIYVDDDGRAYIEAAHLSIRSDGVGSVFLRNEPPISGLKRCPQPFAKFLGKIGKFVMEFGF